ncbi:hypothetical protein SERLA73DRAFT_72057 [Serpula lacrymans var. lacrymans S7.3]|uniref:Uncharacterized protein n=2 Tax=Serpula lacrymans var. lacrymans TaxID=341189 RepID=F8PTU2_SERL3|nr:uncharacterized protein SERLADRAFT_436565 [Serpula lacrymans var. lacrymans S7.9]EGO01087.1 hypothetical protein SERLA73DRAFT_72057 [Serpula lacrymans var. lacrymans S7.3]EGO26745.1 hypothetical protein SERLADRAFT_436565 [Serpula lacrymans var. lacrymans S7.9]
MGVQAVRQSFARQLGRWDAWRFVVFGGLGGFNGRKQGLKGRELSGSARVLLLHESALERVREKDIVVADGASKLWREKASAADVMWFIDDLIDLVGNAESRESELASQVQSSGRRVCRIDVSVDVFHVDDTLVRLCKLANPAEYSIGLFVPTPAFGPGLDDTLVVAADENMSASREDRECGSNSQFKGNGFRPSNISTWYLPVFLE